MQFLLYHLSQNLLKPKLQTTAPAVVLDYVSIPAQAVARENAKEVVKATVLAVVKHPALQHVNNNAQVLVVKHVQVVAAKPVAEVVRYLVKEDANHCVRMTAQWVVKDNVPMDAQALVEVLAAMGVVVVAMVLQGYSKWAILKNKESRGKEVWPNPLHLL